MSNATIALYTEELKLSKAMRDKMVEFVDTNVQKAGYELRNKEHLAEELLGVLAMAVDWDSGGNYTREELRKDKLFWAYIASSGCLRPINQSLRLCDWEIPDITALRVILGKAISLVMRPINGGRKGRK